MFFNSVKKCVDEFKKLDGKPIKIVGHLDADGISAASILAKAFQREGAKFSLSIVRQLDKTVLEEIKREDNKVVFFVDMGSGYLKMIDEILSKKKIFVLDHHKPENTKESKILGATDSEEPVGFDSKFIHLNPHLFGIDGSADLSGAGVVYYFCKELNPLNKDLAYLGVMGAIGDMQEGKKGFSELNEKILKDAIECGKIEVKNGLRMFGMQTKPIHKVLEYSTNPYIPNVTGSKEGAKQFLKEIGIELKKGGKFKKMIHLDEDDMKKLVTAIILKRLGSEDKPDDVLGPIYLLKDEDEENPTKDLKEFATLLNACGRLNKPSLGLGACLGSSGIKKKAIDLLIQYKREIINSLDWFYANKNKGKKVTEKKGYVIINAEDNIRDTLIGTLASIVSKSNVYVPGTVIVSMVYTYCDEIKVSARICGRESCIDLGDVMRKVVSVVGGIGGGHNVAAGALIPLSKEQEFIDEICRILDKQTIEEVVK